MDSNYVLHKKNLTAFYVNPQILDAMLYVFLYSFQVCVCVCLCVCVCVCALVPGIFTDLFLDSLNHYC